MATFEDLINSLGTNPRIRTFGPYSDYKPEGDHKDVVYFATDQQKIYLNGKLFGGSDESETPVLKASSLFKEDTSVNLGLIASNAGISTKTESFIVDWDGDYGEGAGAFQSPSSNIKKPGDSFIYTFYDPTGELTGTKTLFIKTGIKPKVGSNPAEIYFKGIVTVPGFIYWYKWQEESTNLTDKPTLALITIKCQIVVDDSNKIGIFLHSWDTQFIDTDDSLIHIHHLAEDIYDIQQSIKNIDIPVEAPLYKTTGGSIALKLGSNDSSLIPTDNLVSSVNLYLYTTPYEGHLKIAGNYLRYTHNNIPNLNRSQLGENIAKCISNLLSNGLDLMLISKDTGATLISLLYHYTKDLNTRFDDFLNSADTSNEAINRWKEIENFLTGVTDTQTLTGMLEELKTNLGTEIGNTLASDYIPKTEKGAANGVATLNEGRELLVNQMPHIVISYTVNGGLQPEYIGDDYIGIYSTARNPSTNRFSMLGTLSVWESGDPDDTKNFFVSTKGLVPYINSKETSIKAYALEQAQNEANAVALTVTALTSRVETLETENATLKTKIASLETSLANLQAAIDDLYRIVTP